MVTRLHACVAVGAAHHVVGHQLDLRLHLVVLAPHEALDRDGHSVIEVHVTGGELFHHKEGYHKLRDACRRPLQMHLLTFQNLARGCLHDNVSLIGRFLLLGLGDSLLRRGPCIRCGDGEKDEEKHDEPVFHGHGLRCGLWPQSTKSDKAN